MEYSLVHANSTLFYALEHFQISSKSKYLMGSAFVMDAPNLPKSK
jgi:hypothetical protein